MYTQVNAMRREIDNEWTVCEEESSMGVAYATIQWGVSECLSDRFSHLLRSPLCASLRLLTLTNFPSEQRVIARERDRKENIFMLIAFLGLHLRSHVGMCSFLDGATIVARGSYAPSSR